MTRTKLNPKLLWRSVITDNIKYDVLTGTYHYTEPAVPQTFNQFWTLMGQPRHDDKVYSRHKDKKY